MKPLYLYYDGTNQIDLSEGTDSVIKGCRYSPGTGKVSQAEQGEVIDEVLELYMEGSDTDLDSKIFEIEKYLGIARLEPVKRDWIYLRFWDDPYDWKSRIIDGEIEYMGHGITDRDNESQWAKIHIRRLNYWAGASRPVPCFKAGDAEPTERIWIDELYGHSDSGHKNYFGLCGHVSDNDLPTPVDLYFNNLWDNTAYADITLSQRLLRGTDRTDAGWVEGEDLAEGADATKTDHADADCSDGNYSTFAWTDTDEIQLATWAITGAELAILRGQVQRGIMRLQAANAAADIWLRLKVMDEAGATVLAESIWMLLPTSTKYIELPPIAIPYGLLDLDLYQPVTLGIYVRKPTGGAVDLAIDFIQFVPAANIRRLDYIGVAQTQGANQNLVDESSTGNTYFMNNDGTKKLTHIATGSQIMIYPGADTIIHFHHMVGGVGSWTLATRTAITPYYEPRRRNL